MKRKKIINFEEVYPNHLAFDRSYGNNENEAKTDNNLESHGDKEDLEEVQNLKREIIKMKIVIDEREVECTELRKKVEVLYSECKKLSEKLKEMEENLIKEQKKAHLLEVENIRNIDEIKALKKEKNELMIKLSKSQNERMSILNRIVNFFKNLFNRS